MHPIWIVVADNSIARFFKANGRNDLPSEVGTLQHPEGRLKEGEIVSDTKGRTFDSIGEGRHAMEPATSQKHQLSLQFARHIAERIDKSSDQYEQLIIAAPPHFLGLLRKQLSDNSRSMVSQEIDKDLTHLEPKELTKYLVR